MSDLQADSLEAYDRLLSEQSSYINEVDAQISKWKQFQNDYQQLQTRLSTLPDRLTYECTVPFGKLAFIPGRIVHSNEILVLLGENYFVERSCKQAQDIVRRRLDNINEKLENHRKEKELFDQQKKYTNNFLDDKTKFIEIKETDEDEEVKKSSSRRAKLSEEEIREERRRLQERAMKMTETKPKHVHFEENQMKVDSDDEEDDIPHQQFKKILIHHTDNDSQPTTDSSSALFSHPGAIGATPPKAFTGKMIEREVTRNDDPLPPPKRISKFKASRQ